MQLTKIIKITRKHISLLTATFIIFIGGYVASHNLQLGFIFDEGIQLHATKSILETGIPQINNQLYFPGLTISYPHAILTKFGLLNVSEYGARSLTIGIYAIFCFYFWTNMKRKYNNKIALLSLMLLSWNTSILFMARYYRGYITLILFFTATIFFYLNYLPTHKTRTLYYMIVSYFLAILSHPLGLLLTPLFIPIWIHSINHRIITTLTMTSGTLLAFYMSNLYQPNLVPQPNHSSDWFFSNSISNPLHTQYLLYFPRYYQYISSLFIFSLIWDIKNIKKNISRSLSIIFIILIITISLFSHYRETRYLYPLIPLFIIAISHFIHKTIKIHTNKLFGLIPLCLILILIPNIFTNINNFKYIQNINYSSPMPPNQTYSQILPFYPDYKTTSTYINNQFQTGDLIIASINETNSYNYQFYIHPPISYRALPLPDKHRIHHHLTVLTTIEEFKNTIKQYPGRIWLITDYLNSPRCLSELYHCNISTEWSTWLSSKSKHIKYQSPDHYSTVYLFE